MLFLTEHSRLVKESVAKQLNTIAGDKCYTLRETISTTNSGKFVWRALGPILEGYIYYTPITEYTTTVMNEVISIPYFRNTE